MLSIIRCSDFSKILTATNHNVCRILQNLYIFVRIQQYFLSVRGTQHQTYIARTPIILPEHVCKIFGGSDTSATIFLEGPTNIVSDICCSDSSIMLSQFVCVRFWRIPHGHNSIFGGSDQHSYQTYVARILQKYCYMSVNRESS